MSASLASVGIMPLASSLIGMLYGPCVALSGLGVHFVFGVVCIGGCTSNACLSSSFAMSIFLFLISIAFDHEYGTNCMLFAW